MKKLNRRLTMVFLGLMLLSMTGLYLLGQQETEQNLKLDIHKNGQLYREIPLSAVVSQEINITDAEGHYNLIEIQGGKVRVKEADCPNQVCVNTGWISMPGQIAFCAPNKVKIKLTGHREKVDAISN